MTGVQTCALPISKLVAELDEGRRKKIAGVTIADLMPLERPPAAAAPAEARTAGSKRDAGIVVASHADDEE